METVRDRKNWMEYQSNLFQRGIQRKKPHRNRIGNKNFPLGTKNHCFWPFDPFYVLDLLTSKLVEWFPFYIPFICVSFVQIRKLVSKLRNDGIKNRMRNKADDMLINLYDHKNVCGRINTIDNTSVDTKMSRLYMKLWPPKRVDTKIF